MKLNNRGFAISVILYSLVILMMGVMYLLLDIINNRYRMTKELKENVVEYINSQGINTVSEEYSKRIATNKLIKSGELTYHTFGNYYYTGNNPKNFVKFNNELWRIIGIMDINDIKYLKIVRNEAIIEETSDNNHIINSNIFTYLNGPYYASLKTRTMIKKINWYNSEHATTLTPLNAYNEESITTSKKEANVGLISASDFGYTAPDDYLVNPLGNYAVSINENWLATTNKYFTMSFQGTQINVINNGNLESTSDMKAYIYPCVYLKKDILITSGTGEETNPYILSN